MFDLACSATHEAMVRCIRHRLLCRASEINADLQLKLDAALHGNRSAGEHLPSTASRTPEDER